MMKPLSNNFELQACNDDHEWDQYLAESEQCNIFSSSDYLKMNGMDTNRYLLVEKKQFVMGFVLPILYSNDKSINPKVFSSYHSIFLKKLANSANYSSDLKTIEYFEFISNNLILNRQEICLSLHHSLTDIRGLVWPFHNLSKMRVQVENKYTGIIDLQQFSSFQEYLTSIRKVRVQELNRANNSTIYTSCGPEKIGTFTKIYEKTFQKNGIAVSKEEIRGVERVLQHGLSSNTGKLILLENEAGQCISGIYFDRYLDTFYYLFGANDPEFLNLHGSTLLILHMIGEAFLEGIKFVDMVGMNSPRRGNFKATFNARPNHYFELQTLVAN